jgi:hypothetical protein
VKTFYWENPDPVEPYEQQGNAIVVAAVDLMHARILVRCAIADRARKAWKEFSKRRKYVGFTPVTRAAYVGARLDRLERAPWFRKRPRTLRPEVRHGVLFVNTTGE